ncbi:MAG: RIP metalloprotease RseP [Hyphomicrobiaceae bacterium]|nr:RIP metalloprotease RseP [Hyphomicrobiaceae bacterium]
MDILASIGTLTIGTIVPFLFVLTIIVFFHELGHFLVGRWCGVEVKTFSIGFGPEIAGFNDRQGTRWRLSLIPLGGYVKFLGDENAASAPDRDALKSYDRETYSRTMEGQSVGKRAAIVAAGPIANFILAIVIFTGVFATIGETVSPARVDEVRADSAAEIAGILPGDIIVEINGSPIEVFADVPRIVALNADVAMPIVVERDGERLALTITPLREEVRDSFGNVQRVGLIGVVHRPREGDVVVRDYTLPQAVYRAVDQTWFVAKSTLSYLGKVIVGRESADQLSGPIRVAKVSGDVATLGIGALLQLAALISVSIGLINLFPVPLLDGGHLVYYAIEAIRGRPLSDKAQEIGFRFGMAAILALMVFATFNDIVHLLAS